MDNKKEPTQRQVDFAIAISEVVGVDPPKQFSKKAYSAFIYTHLDEFYKLRDEIRYGSKDTFQLEHSFVVSAGYNGDTKLNKNPRT